MKKIIVLLSVVLLLGIGQATAVSAAEEQEVITVTSVKDPGTGGH